MQSYSATHGDRLAVAINYALHVDSGGYVFASAEKAISYHYNGMRDNMKIYNMPASYVSERIQMMSMSFFNLDRAREDMPFHSRMWDTITWEKNAPLDAGAMAVGFMLWPGAQRMAGMAIGAASPGQQALVQRISEQSQQVFTDSQTLGNIVDQVSQHLNESTAESATQTWWYRLLAGTMKHIPGKYPQAIAKTKGPLPRGSVAWYLAKRADLSADSFRHWLAEFKQMTTAEQRQHLSDAMQLALGQIVIESNLNTTINPDLLAQLDPQGLKAAPTPEHLPDVAKQLNQLYADGKIELRAALLRNMTLPGARGIARRAFISQDNLKGIQDPNVRAMAEKYLTIIPTGNVERDIHPAFSLPKSVLDDPAQQESIDALFNDVAVYGSELAETVRKGRAALPQVDTVHLVMRQGVDTGQAMAMLYGLAKPNEVYIALDAKPWDVAHEFAHVAAIAKGQSEANAKTLQDYIDEHFTAEQKAAPGVTEFLNIDLKSAKVKEVMANMFVIVSGHSPEAQDSQWWRVPEAGIARTLTELLRDSPESFQVLRDTIANEFGTEFYQQMRVPEKVVDLYAKPETVAEGVPTPAEPAPLVATDLAPVDTPPNLGPTTPGQRVNDMAAKADTNPTEGFDLIVPDGLTSFRTPDSEESELGDSLRTRQAERRALAIVRHVMNKIGLSGQELTLGPLIWLAKHPDLANAVKSEANWAEFLKRKALSDPDKPGEALDKSRPEAQIFEHLRRAMSDRPQDFPRAFGIQLRGLSTYHTWRVLMDREFRPTRGDAERDTRAEPLSTNVRQFTNVVRLQLPRLLGQRIGGYAREMQTDKIRYGLIRLIRPGKERRKRDVQSLSECNTPKDIAKWMSRITGISPERWESVGVVPRELVVRDGKRRRVYKTVWGGKHRLEMWKSMLMSEIEHIYEMSDPNLKQETRDKFGFPPVGDHEAFFKDIQSRVYQMFMGQLTEIQRRAMMTKSKYERAKAPVPENVLRAAGLTYPIIEQLARHARHDPVVGNPARIRLFSRKMVSMVSQPSHLNRVLDQWKPNQYYMLGGTESRFGRGYDSHDPGEMYSPEITEYSRAEFDAALRDRRPYYGHYAGQVGDKVNMPSLFIDMPVFDLGTMQGKQAAMKELSEYRARYDHYLKHAKFKDRIGQILTSPGKILAWIKDGQSADASYALNHRIVLEKLFGPDLSHIKSAADLVKRFSPMATPAQEPTVGVEGGLEEFTRAVFVLDPLEDVVHSARQPDGSQLVTPDVETADSMVVALRDAGWSRKYNVSQGHMMQDTDDDGFRHTKLLHMGIDPETKQPTQIKCQVARDDVAAMPGDYLSVIKEAIAQSGVRVDQIVFGSSTKLKGMAKGKEPMNVLRKVNGKWQIAKDFKFTEGHVVNLESRSWRWILDAIEPVDKHSNKVRRQLVQSMTALRGGRELADILSRLQSDQINRLAKMNFREMVQQCGKTTLDKYPNLRDIFDESQPTRNNLSLVEREQIAVEVARFIADEAETKVPGFSHSTVQSALGSDVLQPYRSRRWNSQTLQFEDGDYDMVGGYVTLPTVLANVDNAKGNDEVTPGRIRKEGSAYIREPGMLLGQGIKGRELFFRTDNQAKTTAQYAEWMAKNYRLRPDLFRDIPEDGTRQRILDAVSKHRGDVNALMTALLPDLRMEDVRIEQQAGAWEAHIPGELMLWERVPTGGPDAIGLARLTTFKPNAGNVIHLHESDRVKSGMDFDIDSTHNYSMTWGKDGKISGAEGQGQMNRFMLKALKVFTDLNNVGKISTPLNKKVYDTVLGDVRDTGALNELDNTMRDTQMIGKRGLSIAAVSSRIWSTLVQNGVFGKSAPGTRAVVDFPLPGREDTLKFDFSKERMQALAQDPDSLFAIQQDMTTFLNLFADNNKLECKVEKLGISDVNALANLLLVWGSPGIVDTVQRIEMRRKIRDLMTSPDAQDAMLRIRARRELRRDFITRPEKIDIPPEFERIAGIPVGENIRLAQMIQGLFDLANDFSTIQRAINVQFEPPTTWFGVQEARKNLNLIKNNELSYLDTTGLVRNGQFVTELRAAERVLDIIENVAFPEDRSVSRTPIGGQLIDEFIGPDKLGQERKQESAHMMSQIFGQLYMEALRHYYGQIGLDIEVQSQNVLFHLERLQRAHPQSELLQNLEIGLGPDANGVTRRIVRPNAYIRYLEVNNESPDADVRMRLRKEWDSLIGAHHQVIADALAYHTINEHGTIWHNQTGSLYNLIGPQSLERLERYVQPVFDAWRKGERLNVGLVPLKRSTNELRV